MVLLAFTVGLLCGCQTSITRGTTIILGMDNAFGEPRTYLFAAGTVSIMLLQLFFLNRGMEMYPAIEMMPIYHTFVILLNMMCGLIVLDEKDQYSIQQLIMLFGFTAITSTGVFILVRKIDFGICCSADDNGQ